MDFPIIIYGWTWINAGQGIQAGNRTPNPSQIPNSSCELAPLPSFFREEFFPPAPPSPPGFSFPFPLGNIGLTHFPGSWGWICIIPPVRRDAGAADAPEQMMLRETSAGTGRAKISQLLFLSPQIPPFFRGFLFLLPSCSFPRELPGFGKLHFSWSISGFAPFLPGFKVFFSFLPRLVSLLGFRSFPKLQRQLPGAGGDGWIRECRGGSAGAAEFCLFRL